MPFAKYKVIMREVNSLKSGESKLNVQSGFLGTVCLLNSAFRHVTFIKRKGRNSRFKSGVFLEQKWRDLRYKMVCENQNCSVQLRFSKMYLKDQKTVMVI